MKPLLHATRCPVLPPVRGCVDLSYSIFLEGGGT